jgi:hypothetical protein
LEAAVVQTAERKVKRFFNYFFFKKNAELWLLFKQGIIYALILTKNILGHTLGDFLLTHLVTLNQCCQMVYLQTKNTDLGKF